jgi:DNA polymerase III sliding clamp (beta) subunit (PCNA family)
MKFDKIYRPELCCSKDPTRFILDNVCVKNAGADGTERPAFLDATDGRSLVRVPCLIEASDVVGDGIIPSAILKIVRAKTKAVKEKTWRGVKKFPAVMKLSMLKETFVFEGTDCTIIWKRHDQGIFPNTSAVIPETDASKPVKEPCFNPFLLSNVCQAMGLDPIKQGGVVISAASDLDPLVIKSSANPLALGVIMPMRRK